MDRAREIGRLAFDHREATEAGRQLAPAVVEQLRSSGLCRLALPESDGGLELPPTAALPIYETLAAAEASLAWVVWNNSLICWFARFLDHDANLRIFGDPRSMFASSTRPSGKAELDGDRYRVTGRWSLVSGCMHAQWLPVMCLVTEDGAPRMLDEATPEMRMCFFPREELEIIDTWYTGGLRGTGSHDVVIEGGICDRDMTIGFTDPSRLDKPFGRVPIIVTMSAGCAAICLGIARSALAALVELGRTKVTRDPVPDLRDRPATQQLVARASVRFDGLAAELHTRYAALWEALRRDSELDLEMVAGVWRTSVATALECRDLLGELQAAGGTTVLYTSSPIERAHRDICAVTQHVVVQPLWLEQAGRVQLGLPPTQSLYAL